MGTVNKKNVFVFSLLCLWAWKFWLSFCCNSSHTETKAIIIMASWVSFFKKSKVTSGNPRRILREYFQWINETIKWRLFCQRENCTQVNCTFNSQHFQNYIGNPNPINQKNSWLIHLVVCFLADFKNNNKYYYLKGTKKFEQRWTSVWSTKHSKLRIVSVFCWKTPLSFRTELFTHTRSKPLLWEEKQILPIISWMQYEYLTKYTGNFFSILHKIHHMEIIKV